MAQERFNPLVMARRKAAEAGRILRVETAHYLGRHENLEHALRWARNGTVLQDRIVELDEIVGLFSSRSNDFPQETHKNALNLKSEIGCDGLTLLSSVTRTADRQGAIPLEALLCDETFRDVDDKISFGEMRFPLTEQDPQRIASGLLIEGYGLYIARLKQQPGLARKVVLAIEELMWNNRAEKDYDLLKDVLPWMVEERDGFGTKMRQELEEYQRTNIA